MAIYLSHHFLLNCVKQPCYILKEYFSKEQKNSNLPNCIRNILHQLFLSNKLVVEHGMTQHPVVISVNILGRVLWQTFDLVFCCRDKRRHYGQRAMQGGKVLYCLYFSILFHYWRIRIRIQTENEIRAGADLEAMEECCFLAWSL